MGSEQDRLAFVVSTKDRPKELRRLLESLALQIRPPEEIVIVDGSRPPMSDIVWNLPRLCLKYIRVDPPSLIRQRLAGIKAVSPDAALIGFLDDDSVLEAEALERMREFWAIASPETGGASFNMANYPKMFAASLKASALVRGMGLFSCEPGVVLPSGFHTMIGVLDRTRDVRWLPAGAVLWRRRVIEEFHLDPWYEGYGYLDDLDFSYRVGKKYRLAVVAEARYFHYPSPRGRMSEYRFGRQEVCNRLYFVRRNQELSIGKCYLALVARAGLSLVLAVRERRAGYLRRILGNLVGLVNSFAGGR